MISRLEIRLKKDLLDAEGAGIRRKAKAYFKIEVDDIRVIRVLTIDLGRCVLPENIAASNHALEVAVFAIGKTTKVEQIDEVEVVIQASDTNKAIGTTTNTETYRFALGELMQAQR